MPVFLYSALPIPRVRSERPAQNALPQTNILPILPLIPSHPPFLSLTLASLVSGSQLGYKCANGSRKTGRGGRRKSPTGSIAYSFRTSTTIYYQRKCSKS